MLRERARQKVEWLEQHPPPLDADGDGLITIDGKQVAAGVGGEVLRIRAAGRWKGTVVSGYRTPEHSQALCFAMCGRPSVSGSVRRARARATRLRGVATARST